MKDLNVTRPLNCLGISAQAVPIQSRPFGGQVVDQRVELARVWICPLRLFAAPGTNKRGLDLCGQATKGAWGMSWRQEALKGVEDCEKLGGTVKRVLIPRFPNRHALNS